MIAPEQLKKLQATLHKAFFEALKEKERHEPHKTVLQNGIQSALVDLFTGNYFTYQYVPMNIPMHSFLEFSKGPTIADIELFCRIFRTRQFLGKLKPIRKGHFFTPLECRQLITRGGELAPLNFNTDVFFLLSGCERVSLIHLMALDEGETGAKLKGVYFDFNDDFSHEEIFAFLHAAYPTLEPDHIFLKKGKCLPQQRHTCGFRALLTYLFLLRYGPSEVVDFIVADNDLFEFFFQHKLAVYRLTLLQGCAKVFWALGEKLPAPAQQIFSRNGRLEELAKDILNELKALLFTKD